MLDPWLLANLWDQGIDRIVDDRRGEITGEIRIDVKEPLAEPRYIPPDPGDDPEFHRANRMSGGSSWANRPFEIVVGPTGPAGVQGLQGPQGPSGGVFVTGWWNYNINTAPPPGTGQIRTAPDVTVVGEPMTIWLHTTDDDGLYWGPEKLPRPGDEVELRGTLGAVQTISVISVVMSDDFATIETVVLSSNKELARQARVELGWVRPA